MRLTSTTTTQTARVVSSPEIDPASVQKRIAAALTKLSASAGQLHPYEARYLANLLESVANTYSRPLAEAS